MRRGLMAAMTWLSILAVSGCFFDTREPEPPSFQGSCDYEFIFPQRYEDVLANLNGAFQCTDQTEYLEIIATDFEFRPNSFVLGQYPDVFGEPWTKTKESLFIGNIFNDFNDIVANMGETVKQVTVEGDRRTLTVTYRIDIPGLAVYSADAILVIERRGPDWFLVSWEDLDIGDLSFGELRGDAAN